MSKTKSPPRPLVATLKNASKIHRFERVAIARGHVDADGAPKTSTAFIELAEERLIEIEKNGDPAVAGSVVNNHSD
jgi:hypothetical protein